MGVIETFVQIYICMTRKIALALEITQIQPLWDNVLGKKNV